MFFLKNCFVTLCSGFINSSYLPRESSMTYHGDCTHANHSNRRKACRTTAGHDYLHGGLRENEYLHPSVEAPLRHCLKGSATIANESYNESAAMIFKKTKPNITLPSGDLIQKNTLRTRGRSKKTTATVWQVVVES
jgi:hypothetical protein